MGTPMLPGDLADLLPLADEDEDLPLPGLDQPEQLQEGPRLNLALAGQHPARDVDPRGRNGDRVASGLPQRAMPMRWLNGHIVASRACDQQHQRGATTARRRARAAMIGHIGEALACFATSRAQRSP